MSKISLKQLQKAQDILNNIQENKNFLIRQAVTDKEELQYQQNKIQDLKALIDQKKIEYNRLKWINAEKRKHLIKFMASFNFDTIKNILTPQDHEEIEKVKLYLKVIQEEKTAYLKTRNLIDEFGNFKAGKRSV